MCLLGNVCPDEGPRGNQALSLQVVLTQISAENLQSAEQNPVAVCIA